MKLLHKQLKILVAIGALLIAAVFAVAAFTPLKEQHRFVNQNVTTGEQSAAPNGVADDSASALINLNTADSATLQTLPHIGEKTAQNIILYRQEHGAFTSISELMNVSGIGETIFREIEPLVCV